MHVSAWIPRVAGGLLWLIVVGTAPHGLAGGQERLPVLMYHHLTESTPASAAELHVDCFERQMRFLHEHGYVTLTLAEFAVHHAVGAFPERSLLITFDDGYRSFLEHAHPVLRAYGFGAVLFPVVAYRPGLQRSLLWSEHLSFHDIRRMHVEGGLVEVGSHTYDLHHETEAGLPAALRQPWETASEHLERVGEDLGVSRVLLRMQTDQEVTALAWPYGVASPELAGLAQDIGFAWQFTTDPGYVTRYTPATAVPRFTMAAEQGACFQDVLDGAGCPAM